MNTKFLPKQLKELPEFIDIQDVITVALDPDRFYTIDQANQALQKVLNREVD